MTTPRHEPDAPAPGTGMREELFRAVLRGDPLQNVVRAAERALGRHVHVELVDGPAASPASEHSRPGDGPGHPRRRFAITAARRRLGTLTISEAAGVTTPDERAFAREVAMAFAMYALLHRAAGVSDEPPADAVPSDPWLEGRFEAWSRERGLPADQRLTVLLIMLADAKPSHAAVETLRHGLDSVLAARRIDAFVAWRDDSATVAIVGDDQRAARAAQSVVANLEARLRVFEPETRFYVGIAPSGTASRFALRAGQARLAARVGANRAGAVTTTMTELRAHGAMRAAMAGADSPTAFGELHARYLGAIIAQEQRTGLPLLHTLMAFFDANCNVSAAARALQLTRQAMYYRIRRIEELTDLSLEDPFDRFALELAFRSWAGAEIGEDGTPRTRADVIDRPGSRPTTGGRRRPGPTPGDG